MVNAELDALREQAMTAFATDETYAVLMCRMAHTILRKRRSAGSRREPDDREQHTATPSHLERIKTT